MKKTVCLLLACIILLMPISSCAQSAEKVSDSFLLMDTLITVTLYATPDTDTAAIFSECRAILEELDALWSRTEEESVTTCFNLAKKGPFAADWKTCDLLERALKISETTGGAFDITVAPIVMLWQRCEEEQRLPTDAEMLLALSQTDRKSLYVLGTNIIKREDGTQIDLGGIGKGEAISYLVTYLESCPIEGALVSFGSNVAVVGNKPDGRNFRVAVKNPIDGNDYAKVLELSAGQVLSVSGDYERYYTIGGEQYHHIIDPATGYPAESGLCSVAVICEDGALADRYKLRRLIVGIAERGQILVFFSKFRKIR